MAETGLMMSQTMREEVMKVLSNMALEKFTSSRTYNIVATFTSRLNSAVDIRYSREILKLTIEQDYVRNFTDKIRLSLELFHKDARVFYNNRRELFCMLEFYQMSPNSIDSIDNTPAFSQQYRAILLNTEDIFKNIPATRLDEGAEKVNDMRNVAVVNLDFELITDKVYKSRKIRMNLINRDITMMDALIETINHYGFKQARIMEPDNEENYTNLVIPPDHGVADIIGFLQCAPGMGLYNNGLCSYITEDCWYVFPRYGEYLPKRVVQIYSVGLTNYEGLGKYDYNELIDDGEDMMTHIIVNGAIEETNWSSLGTENKPNAYNIGIDQMIIDNAVERKGDGKLHVVPIIRNVASLATEPISMDDPLNIKFIHDNGNIYYARSEIGSYNNTTIGFTWKACFPYAFHPGTRVNFNYDAATNYRTISGKCEYVKYTFERQVVTNYPIFAGIAEVQIRCDNTDALKAGCT